MRVVAKKWIEFQNNTEVSDNPLRNIHVRHLVAIDEIVSISEHAGLRETPYIAIRLRGGNRYEWYPPLVREELGHVDGHECARRMRDFREAQLASMHQQYATLKSIILLHYDPMPEPEHEHEHENFGGLA